VGEGDGGVCDELDGTVPAGSMITNSVTKTSQKNFMTGLR
jgi:hypothetical protein